MTKTGFLLMIVALTMLIGCGKDKLEFKEHKSGFEYAFIDRAEAGLSPRIGDIATLRLTIKAPNDSVLKRADFFRIQLKKSEYKGGINQALRFMREGDSMAFLIDAKKYYRYDEKDDVPEMIKSGDKLRFDIRMVDIKSLEEFERERKVKKISGEKRELFALKAFLRRSAIQDSASLDRIYVKTLRSTKGNRPQQGDNVAVHYFGYFVDGSPFDNSYERGKPFEIHLGANQVIEGLERGVKKMQVGEKATIVIPSPLAYGKEGLPRANIAPFTTLVFDVELLEIK